MVPCGGRGAVGHCDGGLLACNRNQSARKKVDVCICTLVRGTALVHSRVHDMVVAGRNRGQVFHSVQLGNGNGESPRTHDILCSCGGSLVEVEVVEVVEVWEEGEEDGMASHGASWDNDDLACGDHDHDHTHDLHE